MGKSDKHKKARKADFIKTKLKLGKGKEILQNATNTAIASKSIALPAQSLAETKDVPTSRRNLSLPDLLVQCRHYSASVKKEALLELQQLLVVYPFLLHQHLLPLISSISHLISDPVPTLRTATLSLLSYIFSLLPITSLESSTQGLTLFTISALSSLDEGVRIDALKALDLLLEKIPDAIVRGWDYSATSGEEAEGQGTGAKVIEALLAVLRVRAAGLAVGQGGFTSAASSDLSPSSRQAILTTLSTFLRASLSPQTITALDDDTALPPWYLSTSFATPRQYQAFVQSFSPNPPRTITESYPTEFDSFYVENFDLAMKGHSSAEFPLDFEIPAASTSTLQPAAALPASLLTLLHPTLLSSFLDSAPSAFSPSLEIGAGTDSHLTTITAVIAVAKELYWAELGGVQVSSIEGGGGGREKERESARKLLVTMLSHVGVYFPFGDDELETRSKKGEAQLSELNLTFASLVSLLVLSTPESSKLSKSKGKQTKTKARLVGELSVKIELMVERVCEWVIEALNGTIVSAAYPLGQALTPEAYSALEPTIWSLLNQPPPIASMVDGPLPAERVFAAVLAHFSKSSSGTPSKKKAFEFIARAVLIQTTPGYNNRFATEDSAEPNSIIGTWLLSLPKYLWELNSKHPLTTELVLKFLERIAQQGRKGLINPIILSSLLNPLSPYFHLQHPSRGSIKGPFTNLSLPLQKKSLDLVWYLSNDSEDLESVKRLSDAVTKAVRGKEEIAERWRVLGLMN